jgi:hypothetical protein
MKISEIKVGFTYTNGKGRNRKVIDEGDYPCTNMIHQDNRDCLLYKITLGNKHGEYSVGNLGKITRKRFANWAKARI